MVDNLKWTTVTSSEVENAKFRLEATAFNVEAKKAKDDLNKCRYNLKPLTGTDGFAEAYRPGIVKRIFVNRGYGVPMFTPSEIVTINPKPEKFLSKYTNTDLTKWNLKEGEIALTCSGTIGHAAYVSKTLDGKCFSQNMIRIVAKEYPGYLYAFIQSKTGQLIIQTNNYGAVIQHIDPDHLDSVLVPDAPTQIKKSIHEKVVASFNLRDKSNELLETAESILIKSLKLPAIEKVVPELFNASYDVQNFVVPLNQLDNRFDASYHIPVVNAIIDCLLDNTDKILPLGSPELTSQIILPGRFKRHYVGEDYGTVFLGGKQIYELNPYNKKYLSVKKHGSRIESQLFLHENMIAITCSGTIGRVNLIPKHWENWTMSQHVLRAVPVDKNIAGYLYCWLNTDYGYWLIERYTYGSVIDEISDKHLSKVPIPILKDKAIMKKVNDLALEANKLRSEAYYLEQDAINEMNKKVIFEVGSKQK